MDNIQNLITDNLHIWSTALDEKKSGRGRGGSNKGSIYGVKKLRELILDLAVRGKLVPQDPNDEPASELLKRIEAEKQELIKEGKIKKEKPLAPISDEEKPFDLPNGWEWARLQDIKTKLTDGSHNPPANTGSGYPMLSSQNVLDGEIDFLNPSRFVDETGFALEDSRTRVQAGDVLLNIVASLGRSAVVPNDFPKFVLQRSVAVITIRIIPEYLIKYFSSITCKIYFDTYAKGTAQKGLYLGKLAEMPITIPPLAEQHRIVAKVDELMKLCDDLEAGIINSFDVHSQLVETLLNNLCTSQNNDDFNSTWQIIYNNFETLFTTEESIEKLKQSILQLCFVGRMNCVENELKYVSVDSVFDLIDGDRGSNYPKQFDYKSEGYCLFLSTKNVRKNGFLFEELQFITKEKSDELRQGMLRRGDIVITTRGTLGNVAFYDEKVLFDRVRINSGMLILRPKVSDLEQSFFTLFIQSPLFEREMSEKSSGSAQPQIPAKALKSFNFPMYSKITQQKIVETANNLLRVCDELKSKITLANQTKITLANTISQNLGV